MKKYLPLLLLSMIPEAAQGQVKIEGSQKSFDAKSPYFQSFLRNPRNLSEFENTQGEIKGKFRDNSVYVIRNGLLNHTYGGNLDLSFLEGYGNFTNQSKKTENVKSQQSPLGPITTKTTLKDEKKSNDHGALLKYSGFFVSYDDAKSTDGTTGNVLITINGNNDLVSFSTESVNSSKVYGAGFPYGSVKLIQNKHASEDSTGKSNSELFDNLLLNAKYSLNIKGKSAKVSLFHGEDFSGMALANLWRNIDAGLFYSGKERKLRARVSTMEHTRFNERDFERQLENELRLAPRIYDSPLETERRYLEDMFFTPTRDSINILGRNIPFGYRFSIGTDRAVASLNVKYAPFNALLHLSPESRAIGARCRFGIGSLDFKNKEARVGVFFR